jgi:hypothetical protein
VPVGAQFDVKLQTPLNSGTARPDDHFEATMMQDYPAAGPVAIPAGAVVRGFVSSVRASGKIDRIGSITLSFDELLIGTRSQRLRASVVQALDGRPDDDAARMAMGIAAGAAVGGALGGSKGALLGAMVLGGGTIAATDGSDVQLPPGTVLRIRTDEPLDVIPDA